MTPTKEPTANSSQSTPQDTPSPKHATYPDGHPYAAVNDGSYSPQDSDPTAWATARPVAQRLLAEDHAKRPTDDHRISQGRRSALCRYLTWLAEHDPELLQSHPLDTDEIRRYLATDGQQRRNSHRSRVALRSILTSFQTNPAEAKRDTSEPRVSTAPTSDQLFTIALEETQHFRNPITRANTRAVLLLTRAAGLDGSDLRWVTGNHITQIPSAGTWINIVNPQNPRRVPILERYAHQLEDLAEARGPRPMLAATSTAPINPSIPGQLTNTINRALARAGQHGSVNINSLRKAWISEHIAANTPLATLMQAAGVTTLRAFEDLITEHAPAVSDNPTHIAYELGGIR